MAATRTDKNKELKSQVDRVSTSVSNLRDDLATFQKEFDGFKKGVVKDLKNIIEFLGKQKNK